MRLIRLLAVLLAAYAGVELAIPPIGRITDSAAAQQAGGPSRNADVLQYLPQSTVTTITPSVAASAHASGTSIGGYTPISVFKNITRPSGVLNSFDIYSKTGLLGAATVYIWGTPPGATCTDNVAFSMTAGDWARLVVPPFVITPAVIGVGTTGSSGSFNARISVANNDTPASGNLYMCVVTAGVTPASVSEYVFTLHIQGD